MFRIEFGSDGQILPSGRLDHLQSSKAAQFLSGVDKSCLVDFQDLEYISSAGLGVFLAAQKRLSQAGESLRIINPNPHILDIFEYSGLKDIFHIDG